MKCEASVIDAATGRMSARCAEDARYAITWTFTGITQRLCEAHGKVGKPGTRSEMVGVTRGKGIG